jgi:S1-C subfamily serine protease
MIRRRAIPRGALGLLVGLLAVDPAVAACGSGGPFSGVGSQSDPLTGVASRIAPSVAVVDSVLGYQDAEASGTAIVLTASGELLTNNHVIAGATSVTVTDIGNGKTYSATVVGYDRSQDIAVLRLANAQGLATAPIATSSTPAVGDHVVAVGNAGGTGTLSSAEGKVTALGKSITASDASSGSSEQLTGLIQADANIQAGDSGGPLVDATGKVIGVDTAATAGFRFRQTGPAGFAIPIGTAMSVAQRIDAGQSSDTVHIGPTAVLGVQVSAQPANGALILGVVSGSAADKAGLGVGDVITALDGTAVDSATTLTTLMDRHHPGDSVRLKWTRQDGVGRSATVVVDAGPAG